MMDLSVMANKQQSGTANPPKHDSEVVDVKNNAVVWPFRVSFVRHLVGTHSTTVC